MTHKPPPVKRYAASISVAHYRPEFYPPIANGLSDFLTKTAKTTKRLMVPEQSASNEKSETSQIFIRLQKLGDCSKSIYRKTARVGQTTIQKPGKQLKIWILQPERIPT
uniref:Uncharacterized protein n=1 Tax=Romanomermis culicivorax TaxID=13658 RepID=A0A915I877_ROMCU